jgi:D-beta-D-heptose 7-phosphate kinase/D-beta-D-heptose 1-phosphate adenosyltransferase
MRGGESKRLLRIIDRFPKTRVLVVGDVMIDHYVWGNVSRISPEAPVPVVNVTRESLLLGAAANVASNIHALGGAATLCGVIGHDDAGRQLQHMLRSRGIPTDGLIVEPDRQTTIKTRVIAHHQQVVRFDRETKEGISRNTHRSIFAHVTERAEQGLDAIVISDYCKGVVMKELVRDIVRLARRRGIIVSVDPKIAHFGIYSGVTILTPNTKEASLGAKIEIEDEASLLRAGKGLLRKLSCGAVLITRGEHGMSLFEKNGRITHIPTVAREVFDVTGAGDTVISTLTLAMAAGANMVDAAKLSNFAAGIAVGVVGTATVTPDQLTPRIRDHGEQP